MTHHPDIHHRRSLRLTAYDYTQSGAYFIAICTQNRDCRFGMLVHGEMQLNDAGLMVQSVWNEIPSFYPGVEIDAFVVMPNHIHGIVVLVGATPCSRPDDGGDDVGQARGPAPTVGLSLGDVVHRFKTMTTKRYADDVEQSGWPAFPGRLWQRNYYEHIIRNDDSLDRIREYIADNPLHGGSGRGGPPWPP